MKRCIISLQDKDVLNKLKEMGYTCYGVAPSACVSRPISAHSDVLYLKVYSHTIIASSCQKENLPILEKHGYNVIFCDTLKPGYKTESLLNFIIGSDYAVCNPRTAMKISTGKKIIPVNQGYTKCSTLCVNDRAFITDDENIYNTLLKNNFDCLKITKGDILLDGYNYGFIGGASVKLNEKEILFFGDIQNKTDKNNVIEFLNKYNMQAIFIEDKKLTDIGSALIL